MLDTGIFDDDRYFDVFVEYAKAAPDDILMLVTVHNRGPEAAKLSLLPQLWFPQHLVVETRRSKPKLRREGWRQDRARPTGQLPARLRRQPELLFCDNETNARRLFGQPDAAGFFKDAFHEYRDRRKQVGGESRADRHQGRRALRTDVPGGRLSDCAAAALARRTVRHPASHSPISTPSLPGAAARPTSFTPTLQHDIADADARIVQRQAFAGMIWSKQFFHYDVQEWLKGDPRSRRHRRERKHGRNQDWKHLNNADMISMPDKWEYPWFAAWDLAFHCIPLAVIDAEFAKANSSC